MRTTSAAHSAGCGRPCELPGRAPLASPLFSTPVAYRRGEKARGEQEESKRGEGGGRAQVKREEVQGGGSTVAAKTAV